MRSGWKIVMVSVVALGAMGLGACSDDAEPVSQDDYDTEAVRLCEQHGGALTDAAGELFDRPVSDAEQVSFLVAEFVPRARAIVRSLNSFGFPAAKAIEYRAAAQAALGALEEIEEDASSLIERAQAGVLLDEEDPSLVVEEAFTDLDIPC